MNESCSVVVIGGDLKCFTSLNLQCDVKSINVHCNDIREIKGLEKLGALETLDASSNNLSSMSGLSKLSSLIHLNLASNFVTVVDGIGNLNHLTYINLSYNKIKSLQGFVELHGVSSQLRIIELHGNNLSNPGHIVSCLQGIISLKHLVLQRGVHGNPVVNTSGYRKILLNKLPQLVSLDCLNRADEFVDVDDMGGVMSSEWDLPSVQNQVSGEVGSPFSQRLSGINTPRIDAALSARKSSTNLKAPLPDKISDSCTMTTNQPSPGLNKEQQLVTACAPTQSRALKGEHGTTSPHPLQNEAHSAVSPSDDSVKNICSQKTYSATKKVVSRSKLVKPKTMSIARKKTVSPDVISAPASGSSSKTDIVEKQTFLNLLKDLENERERRWKSEQACRKLVSMVREMQMQECEGKSLQQVAAETAERLKLALLSEKNSNESLKQQNQDQTQKLKDVNEKITLLSKQKQMTIQSLQSSLSNANAKIAKLQSTSLRERQELEAKVSNSLACHEADRLKNEQLKMKLDDLQSLLVCREAEYRKSLSGMYSMTNEDFRNAVSKELEKNEKRYEKEVFEFKHKIYAAQTNYSNLECEFREALYIESERYNAINTQCDKATSNACKFEALLTTATEKEEKCRSMLQETTSIIKEQKARIFELTKCKEEMTKQFQNRLDSLQEENKDNRRKASQLEITRHEKSQLASKLSALQSVVDGLKEERRLWGRELAEQGSALSQDRGRLEMRIESLKAEVASLKKDNERDLDSLRIKAKVVEDQTETIFRMKEALSSKDKEIRLKLEEQLVEQRRCEDTIEDLTRENALLQEENLQLNERKQQLKNELANLHQDHEALLDDHEKQKKKWLEKASLLSKLEVQLKSLSDTGKQRELKLVEEKEDALKCLQLAKSKSDQIVAAYQEQLSAANASHTRELESLQRDKREEIQRLQNKVASVEMEMSELLNESEERKKFMDMKVERLKFMLNEFT